MRVAILGGGLTGLTCAYYAQRAGLHATVFEATESSGLLSRRFGAAEQDLDCFHHPISRHDLALCGLLAELGLLHRMVWREVETGVYRDGRVRAIEASDFPPLRGLPGWDRMRAGLASVLCRRWLQSESELHRTSASAWLARYYGVRTYESVWMPLLFAHFGADAEEVPAFVVSRFLRGLLAERRELRGYLLGGYGALCARLREVLGDGGSAVRFATPVRGVQIEPGGVAVATDGGIESFDAAISTLAIPDLAKLASSQLLSALPQSDVEQRAVLSAVALLRRPAALPYRVVDLDGSLGFEQVICSSELLPAAATQPFFPVYLVRHCAGHGEQYRAPDSEIAAAAACALARLDPGLERDAVDSIRVFRAPHVDPVWRLGTELRRAPLRVEGAPLYLCTMAQAYPSSAGSEASIVLARETVRRVLVR
jgi:protoporphyrinogen oxidase